MTNYKSKRPVDGKSPIWVIIDETGKIINKYPTKDELKDLKEEQYTGKHQDGRCKPSYHNDTNTCDICKEEGRETKLALGKARREYNKEGIETGRWLCISCWSKHERKNNPNCMYNKKKSVRNCRTGNQDPNHANAKGDNFQELTCKWRSKISTVTVEDLNIKSDNYKTPIDHSRDSELGIIQTQGRFYDSRNGLWSFSNLEREWDKKFDVIMCYCANKDRKIIERIYIIPFKKEIKDKRKGIGIYKDPCQSRGPYWYEQYRIKDEKILEQVNEIWKKIIKG